MNQSIQMYFYDLILFGGEEKLIEFIKRCYFGFISWKNFSSILQKIMLQSTKLIFLDKNGNLVIQDIFNNKYVKELEIHNKNNDHCQSSQNN